MNARLGTNCGEGECDELALVLFMGSYFEERFVSEVGFRFNAPRLDASFMNVARDLGVSRIMGSEGPEEYMYGPNSGSLGHKLARYASRDREVGRGEYLVEKCVDAVFLLGVARFGSITS